MSLRRYLLVHAVLLVMLIVALDTAAIADAAVIRATLTFDDPVYTNMPVWVHVQFPADQNTLTSSLRYPYRDEPWFFNVNDFDVTLDGKPLPRLKHASDAPQISSGMELGSGAPKNSPRGRLPLHLYCSFSKPGTYMVRFKNYDHLNQKERKLVAESEWTPLVVKPFSTGQRKTWVNDQIAHQPDDVGLIVGDYLPSLLAAPDDAVLPVLLKCLHHPSVFVQNYALNALDYYGDDVIKREIPRIIAKDGPTELLGYYLSWRKALFQPVGKQLADSIVPFLGSDSATTVGGALTAFRFIMPPFYKWDEQPTVPKTIEDAVWAAVPHIRTFKEREALWPLVLFLGQLKTDRAGDLLWQLADVPSVREQALGCICWAKNLADLPKLGPMLASGDKSAYPLAYELRSSFGDAAIPYILEGIRKGGVPSVVESCVRELVQANSVEGFRLFKDALENDRPYKQTVIKLLRSDLSHSWQTSENDLLKLVDERLASLTG